MDMASMDMGSVTSSMSMDMASMSSTISSMASMASATASMSMDMASMSSAMSSMSMDMAASATSTASSSHSHMDMGGMGSSSCKISMLWNWNTIDACFISSDWHIKTRGMFAGTCIGVFAWILALEALRRAHREFDRYVARTSTVEVIDESCCDTKDSKGSLSLISRAIAPNLWQQAVRSLFYTVEFGASYLLMLMAMYYNGYILITMWIAVFLSYFLLSGDTIGNSETKTCC